MGKHVAPRVPVGKKGEVIYEDLFHEDENYDQGPFLEALRDQYCKVRNQMTVSTSMFQFWCPVPVQVRTNEQTYRET